MLLALVLKQINVKHHLLQRYVCDIYFRWWGGHGKCGAFKDTITNTKELDLANVAGIFIVLASGVLLACVACVIEIICIRYKKCQKKVRTIQAFS